MSEPIVFRLVFGALFLLLVGVVTSYRIKAQAGRNIDYSGEGGAVMNVEKQCSHATTHFATCE